MNKLLKCVCPCLVWCVVGVPMSFGQEKSAQIASIIEYGRLTLQGIQKFDVHWHTEVFLDRDDYGHYKEVINSRLMWDGPRKCCLYLQSKQVNGMSPYETLKPLAERAAQRLPQSSEALAGVLIVGPESWKRSFPSAAVHSQRDSFDSCVFEHNIPCFAALGFQEFPPVFSHSKGNKSLDGFFKRSFDGLALWVPHGTYAESADSITVVATQPDREALLGDGQYRMVPGSVLEWRFDRETLLPLVRTLSETSIIGGERRRKKLFSEFYSWGTSGPHSLPRDISLERRGAKVVDGALQEWLEQHDTAFAWLSINRDLSDEWFKPDRLKDIEAVKRLLDRTKLTPLVLK